MSQKHIETPAKGGSYIREADGKLAKIEATKTEPQEPAPATPAAKKKGSK